MRANRERMRLRRMGFEAIKLINAIVRDLFHFFLAFVRRAMSLSRASL